MLSFDWLLTWRPVCRIILYTLNEDHNNNKKNTTMCHTCFAQLDHSETHIFFTTNNKKSSGNQNIKHNKKENKNK